MISCFECSQACPEVLTLPDLEIRTGIVKWTDSGPQGSDLDDLGWIPIVVSDYSMNLILTSKNVLGALWAEKSAETSCLFWNGKTKSFTVSLSFFEKSHRNIIASFSCHGLTFRLLHALRKGYLWYLPFFLPSRACVKHKNDPEKLCICSIMRNKNRPEVTQKYFVSLYQLEIHQISIKHIIIIPRTADKT